MTTAATEKGQITIPNKIRKALHIEKGRKFQVEMTGDGAILLRPLPSADALFGIIKSHGAHNPDEKHIWREARGRAIVHKGRKG
jgi:AbrB family looped-hinge helix DNA binding protein